MNQILTPSGYVNISDINIGDEVIAFDMFTGEEIINTVEGKELVTNSTYPEHNEDGTVNPDILTAYIINNTWTLIKYQSIWVNDNTVKHASQLQIGDTIFNGSNEDVIIDSIEQTELSDWVRFSISGDHSYISDNLTLHNASRFWVGGTGTWDAATTTNWSGTSGGGGGSSVPTSTDDVTFDNLSNATAYACTVSGTRVCQNLSLNAPAAGALTFTPSVVSIFGNFFAAAANVGISNNGSWNYLATSGTKTITSNNLNMQQVLTFNGSGATFQLQSDYKGSTMALTAGTFDPNGYTVTIFGSASPGISGAFTFYNLTREGNGVTKTAGLFISNNITVTNNFTVTGASAVVRFLVTSITLGTPITITAANVFVTNADFQDITGAGAGSWNISAGLTGDCGGNSGITFTTAATQTATGTASFTWSTHGWTTRVPLPQDNVIINNAFIAGRTITADMPRWGKDITFSCTGSPALNPTTVLFYGSIDLTGLGSFLSGGSFTASGRGSHTIKTIGFSLAQAINISAVGGTYTLSDNLSTTSSFNLNNGTFNAATFDVTIGNSFNISGTATKVLQIGSGTWFMTLTSAGTIWSVAGSGATISGNGTIKINGSTTNLRTFIGGGFSYPNLWYTNATASGQLNITGSNTFTSIKCNDTNTQTIRFTAGTTTTISSASGWQISGAASNLISISSITAAQHTISIPSNNVVANYISLTNSKVTGGARWWAQNSTNVSGNNGWRFGQASNRQMAGINSPTLII